MTQEILNIAIFQLDLVWENSIANRANIDQLLQNVGNATDIVFLPEMFTTGFSMNVVELAESMDGLTIKWMKDRCIEYNLAFCGSLIIKDNDHYYNRLLFVEPSGSVRFYDKRHLFTMGNEGGRFQKGMDRLVVNYKGWRICPMICYDIRFPVWSRNRNEYDLLLYSANWPKSRNDVWDTLLKARAIENQSYVAGVNRVGVDGLNIAYSGNSQVFDARGKIIAGSKESRETIVSTEISYSDLLEFRNNFPVLNDADSFSIEQ